MTSDITTLRLGQFLTIVFTVQFLCHLIGVGTGSGTRFDIVYPPMIVLAVLLTRGVRQARTLLLVATWVLGLMVSFLVVVAFTTGSLLGMVLSSAGLALLAAQMVALSFTVPEAGVAGGVPERWRSWGTSIWLHLLILLAGLMATFTAV